MFNFFVALYYALFRGSFETALIDGSMAGTLRGVFAEHINTTLSLIVNALGGDFTSFQTIDFFSGTNSNLLSSAGYSVQFILIAEILATITMVGLCFAVWKITKAIFSIFFGGVR